MNCEADLLRSVLTEDNFRRRLDMPMKNNRNEMTPGSSYMNWRVPLVDKPHTQADNSSTRAAEWTVGSRAEATEDSSSGNPEIWGWKGRPWVWGYIRLWMEQMEGPRLTQNSLESKWQKGALFLQKPLWSSLLSRYPSSGKDLGTHRRPKAQKHAVRTEGTNDWQPFSVGTQLWRVGTCT